MFIVTNLRVIKIKDIKKAQLKLRLEKS